MLNNAGVQSSVANSPVFRIDGGELCLIATDLLKLRRNQLSPFNGLATSGVTLSGAASNLAGDSDLRSLSEVLAGPDLRISFRRGGLTASYETFSAYARKNDGSVRIVDLQDDNGLLSATLLDSAEAYGEYLAARVAAPVNAKPANLIPTTLPVEVLLFILNLTDCYRRAYCSRMLEHSMAAIEGVYADEFAAILQMELKSSDVRWLVPSFTRLVPGLSDTTLEFSGRHLELAEALDFVSTGGDTDGKRPVYYLGTKGKYFGLEFSLLWRNAVGFQVEGLTPNGRQIESLARYYLAPTDEANHLVKLTTGGEEAEFTHMALTAKETADEISELIIRRLLP